jgi:hypothetical protein
VEGAARFEQVVVQFGELLAQIPLEAETLTYRLRLVLGYVDIESAPTPPHRLFDLLGDDRADLAEAFANLI